MMFACCDKVELENGVVTQVVYLPSGLLRNAIIITHDTDHCQMPFRKKILK